MGAVATAYAATRPHASAHGFTDASFQPAFKMEATGQLDAKAAALMATWANKVRSACCHCSLFSAILHSLFVLEDTA